MITVVRVPLLVLVTLTLQTPPPVAPSPVVQGEFVFEHAPFPSAHASTIVETSDGLVAAWFGGTRERDPDVGIWVSRRGGGGWTPPAEVANGVQPDGTRHPCWNPVLFQPSAGPLALFYKVGPSPSEWWGMVRTSPDQGRTWSAATRLPAGMLGPIRAKPIELSPGVVLMGSSTEHDGWVVHMERFTGSWTPDSLGSPSSWEKTGALNDAKEFGAIQPTILVHSPTSIEILCRSRQGVITQAWSEDGGRRWGRMTGTPLPNPSAGIDSVRLRDGRFLLVDNPSASSREKLEVALSTDGKTWSPVAVLEDAAGEYSYPAMIQTRDGLVHVTYTWKRQRIKHVVLDPARLVSPSQTSASNLGSDANGNPLRRATKTGHVSNYDESKVRAYTLPDPLVMSNGAVVRDAVTWMKARRPEIIRMYERDIYGRIPSKTPKVRWQVSETDSAAREGTAVKKRITGTIGDAAAARMNLTLYTPSTVKTPVPVILLVNFGGGATPSAIVPPGDPPVAADIIARGWGYAMVVYQDIQPDRINTFSQGAIGATLAPGQQQPAPDEWGTIGAWAWGVSRIIDYLETDPSVDAKHIAVFGHSRLGKTALWASALDERIAAVYASCSGEMGAALARRDWGETVDDMAQNFPYWFAGNFQQWVGRWNDMPVDAHMLIALSAPRPVFVTGGTKDQWADPKGMFLAEVAAGSVYRLLGKKDLGVTELPPLDTPVVSGELGWHYHTGGHAATPDDWKAFLQFVGKYFPSRK